MKQLATLLFLFTFALSAAQEKNKYIEDTDVKVTSISYILDSPEKLESIDWETIKGMFEYNTESESIEMSFGLNYMKSKHKFKSSITISGETKNLDSLIIKAKKGIKSIIQISEKYKNN